MEHRDPALSIMPPEPGWGQFGVSALALTMILALCWFLAGKLIEKTNLNLGPVKDPVTEKVKGDQDQKHNINQALLTRDEPVREGNENSSAVFHQYMPHRTDGVVAPLWPWVASRLAQPDHVYSEYSVSEKDRQFFVRGKWANVSIVMAFLWGLGLVMARSFRPAPVVTVLLLGTFGALLPRAAYFQPEPLYYVFFFLSWVCALRLLMQNDLWLHLLFGVLSGVAYLAKTSIEPMLMGWFIVSAWRFVRGLFRKEDLTDEVRWTCRNHIFGLIVFGVGWMSIVGPRYSFAQEKWGEARFSYPATWMWFDEFEKGMDWMREHPDKASLEKIPDGERPSFSLYAKTHTREEMANRLVDGYWEKMSRWLAPKVVKPKKDSAFEGWRVILDRRGIYLGGVAAIFLGVMVLMWSRRREVNRLGMSLPCGAGAAGLFVVGTVLGYGLLYGWYDPIGRGDRFMLSLFLPVVFSLVWASENVMDLALMRRAPRWSEHVYQGAFWVLNAAVLWRLVEILRNPVFDPGTL